MNDGEQKTAVIKLHADDDIVSLCDYLDWATAERVLFLVGAARPWRHDGDMARLRRHADNLRCEVGLVTRTPEIAGMARAYGVPVFLSAGAAREDDRQWRRGARSVGLNPLEVRRRKQETDARLRRERHTLSIGEWVRRYATLTAGVFMLAAIFVALVYAIPTATVTVQPYTQTAETRRLLTADPQRTTADGVLGEIPARTLVVTGRRQTEVAATGSRTVADTPAQGQALFTNRGDQPVSIPAGTRVRTADNPPHIYQTTTAASLPAVEGATAEVGVVAAEPGPGGNLLANEITAVDGKLDLQVGVRNPAPITGGGIRTASAVTAADIDRLRAQVTQYLQTAALEQMNAQRLPTEIVPAESLRIGTIYTETYSHAMGDAADSLSLLMVADVQATAVDTNQATDILYGDLARQVGAETVLVPDSFNFYVDGVGGTDNRGRVQVEMVGEGVTVAAVPVADLVPQIAGQEVDIAAQYLYERLPLQSRPAVDVFPSWFGRLPYWPGRIEVIVKS